MEHTHSAWNLGSECTRLSLEVRGKSHIFHAHDVTGGLHLGAGPLREGLRGDFWGSVAQGLLRSKNLLELVWEVPCGRKSDP